MTVGVVFSSDNTISAIYISCLPLLSVSLVIDCNCRQRLLVYWLYFNNSNFYTYCMLVVIKDCLFLTCRDHISTTWACHIWVHTATTRACHIWVHTATTWACHIWCIQLQHEYAIYGCIQLQHEYAIYGYIQLLHPILHCIVTPAPCTALVTLKPHLTLAVWYIHSFTPLVRIG